MARGVRRLVPSDVPACLALAVDRDWGSEEARWRLMLDVGDGYGWEGPDGELCATAVLSRYGRAGVVGMMLVDSRHERRGIGRALMEHLLGEARDLDSVFLYSTAQGLPLYEKLGFTAQHEVAMHIGEFDASAAGPAVTGRPSAEERAQARALDAAVHGLNRSRLLARLPEFADRMLVSRGADGRVDGYAAAWRNLDRTAIGPVLAPGPETARALVTGLAAGSGGPVRLECKVTPDADLRAWALRCGLAEAGRTTFMVRGAPLPTDGARMFAPLMHGLG
ncbi:GNAT family N-acetyltransferase [Kitasatospora sp. NPDC056651]|uniref:GNAT family N-acetyltransferase n=1 Tax=Kitasatospora sp. NPDC056651 TaxID=3345892 RepID=UPI0036C243AC